MDRWELSHWIAHLRLHPSPTDAMTSLAAVLCSVMVNTAFRSKGGAKTADYLIDWAAKPPPPEQKQLQEADAWIRWVATAGS